MSLENIKDIEIEDIKIEAIKNDDILTINIHGRIDIPQPQTLLDPYFNSIHEYILENNIKKAICNIWDLNFINSSGIKCLVNWIMKIPKLSKSKQYNVIFEINKNIHWQKHSINFLIALIPNLISLSAKN